jgi:hypothetical protein
VKQVIWAESESAFALTESGEIYRLNLRTNQFSKGPTGTNAVWDIKKSASLNSSYWAAFEDGCVREFEIAHCQIQILQETNLGYGMIRRVIPHPTSGLFILATGGTVAYLNAELEPKWVYKTRPLLREFALHGQDLILCSETGELSLLDANTGKLRWTRNLELPLWSISIDPSGKNFLVSTRLRYRGDQGQESTPNPAHFMIGDMASGEILKDNPLFGNIKRMTWLSTDRLLINGNGQIATSLLRWPELDTLKTWSAWQLNTAEGLAVYEDRIFTTTYGYQLNTFDINGEILESAFPFEDYATSLLVTGNDLLVAGGRGAFLSLFAIRNGLPVAISTRRFS